MEMSNFSKVERPQVIPNTQGGVWKIEKKRKTRDKKNRGQKYLSSEQNKREEDDSVLVDIERNRNNDRECEGQPGCGLIREKESLCARVDLKI
jgi:hypothetical protein